MSIMLTKIIYTCFEMEMVILYLANRQKLIKCQGVTLIIIIYFRLEGKVAIITGAASGIGEASAKLFSRYGSKVVIADIQDDLAQNVCKDLDPSSTTFVHCDVTKEEDLENVVNIVVDKYGKLDIMYNNAGIMGAVKSNILENEKSDFEKVISTNLVGME